MEKLLTCSFLCIFKEKKGYMHLTHTQKDVFTLNFIPPFVIQPFCMFKSWYGKIIVCTTGIFQFYAIYLIHIIDWKNLLCVIAVLNNSPVCANKH